MSKIRSLVWDISKQVMITKCGRCHKGGRQCVMEADKRVRLQTHQDLRGWEGWNFS